MKTVTSTSILEEFLLEILDADQHGRDFLTLLGEFLALLE